MGAMVATLTVVAGYVGTPVRSALLLAMGTPEVASPAPDGTAHLTAQMDALLTGMAEKQDFSGAALVSRGGHILLSRGYGPAAAGTANTAATPFHIASLTKAFTAMAVLQLQDRAELRITDMLSKYLTASPAAWKAITLQQLLLHTSGIPDYDALPAYGPVSGHHLTPEQVIDLFRSAPLDFAPGTSWKYSDSGYVLLGYIIERVSGLPYGDYLARHVFGPLHMAHTSYDTDPAGPPGLAIGHAAWATPAPYADMSVQFAAGGLSSTLSDMHRWDRALLTGTPALVSASTLRSVFTPHVLTDPTQPATSPSYGYGWVVTRQDGHTLIWHPGNINGFATFDAVYPDDDVVVVVLSNLETSDVHTLGTTLGGMVLDTTPPAALPSRA